LKFGAKDIVHVQLTIDMPHWIVVCFSKSQKAFVGVEELDKSSKVFRRDLMYRRHDRFVFLFLLGGGFSLLEDSQPRRKKPCTDTEI
jgi:hypothetical protein